ncbi:hypothetical protein Q5752_001339 [Cryptotrichosporon argae]
MSGASPLPSPTSPTSPSKISKAAFFRARSPGLYPANTNGHAHAHAHYDHGNDLSARIDGLGMGVSGGAVGMGIGIGADGYASGSGNDGPRRDEYEIPPPPRSHEREMNIAHDDAYDRYDAHDLRREQSRRGPRESSYRPPSGRYEDSLHSQSQTLSLSASSSSAPPPTSTTSVSASAGYAGMGTSAATSPAAESTATFAGSDEMLLTLLASQAAVDCELLPVVGWEEVEAWKKELTLLSTRLESLQARHQREIKILTAARTLQKLNNTNKRMSRQTTESLEQSEKRVEAAEKEVLLLRDREASLRQRLMEHWSGVMAWEVRRLERVSADALSRARDPAQEAEMARRLAQLESSAKAAAARADELETIVERRTTRADELEEVVLEMKRQERATEDELAGLHAAHGALMREKDAWAKERAGFVAEREQWVADHTALVAQHQAAARAVRALEADARAHDEHRLKLEVERDAARDSVGRASAVDRAIAERVRVGLAAVLGRPVDDANMARAVEDIQALVGKKDGEVARLKQEVEELNRGLEEEVRRATGDRDAWKGRAEGAEKKARDELAAMEKQLKAYADKVSDLGLRNESLASSLAVAQAALSSPPPPAAARPPAVAASETRVASLNAELDSITAHFSALWAALPSPDARAAAGLGASSSSSSSSSSSAVASSPLSPRPDPAALLRMYDAPSAGAFGGVDALAARVREAVSDARRLAEHLAASEREKERHKANAAKAARLVDDSRRSLETYQRQVALLEDRLAAAGTTESGALDELNALQAALDDAAAARRHAEADAKQAREDNARLAQANAALSANALDMAQESETDRRAALAKLAAQLDDARAALARAEQREAALTRAVAEAEEGRDDERAAGQAQRIQLLDELNTLQAEVADLRTQLRAAKR